MVGLIQTEYTMPQEICLRDQIPTGKKQSVAPETDTPTPPPLLLSPTKTHGILLSTEIHIPTQTMLMLIRQMHIRTILLQIHTIPHPTKPTPPLQKRSVCRDGPTQQTSAHPIDPVPLSNNAHPPWADPALIPRTLSQAQTVDSALAA
jgi:hypothetical protein